MRPVVKFADMCFNGRHMLEYIFLKSAVELSDSEFVSLRQLLLQLSPSALPLTREYLACVLSVGQVLVVRDADLVGRLIGVGCLLPQPLLTRFVGELQDIVVDEQARGQGIGRTMVERLIVKARQLGITRLTLTSRPARLVANKLYQDLGFIKRETNLYRMEL